MRGEDYQPGDTLEHVGYKEKITAVWSESETASKIYLITSEDALHLTIYAVERGFQASPRLARFVPVDLFTDLKQSMLDNVISSRVKKKQKKSRKRKKKEDAPVPEEKAESRPEKPKPRRRSVPDTDVPKKAEKPSQKVRKIPGRRVQRRKTT